MTAQFERLGKENNHCCSLVWMATFLAFSAFAHAYLTRPLGFILVDIVVTTTKPSTNYNATMCRVFHNDSVENASDKSPRSGKFNWSNDIQANILTMHKWVKLAFIPVSGFLVSIFDPASQLGAMSVLAAFSTVLFPVLARTVGAGGAMVSRAILGVCHAFTSPSTDALVAREVPRSVRSTVYALVTSGSQISMLVGLPLTALLIEHNVLGGWPAAFYVPAILTFAWSACWFIFLWFSYKSTCSRKVESSRSERRSKPAICSEVKSALREIFSHASVWAILPCEVAASVTLSLLIYFIPQYYSDVFRPTLRDISLFSALPFVALMVTKLLVSAAGDALVRAYQLDQNVVSKLFNTVAFVSSGTCIFMIAVLPCLEQAKIVVLVAASAGFLSVTTPGFRLSRTSLTKRWAGVVAATAESAALAADIVFTYVVKALVVNGAEHEWQVVFFVVFCLDLLAAVVYLLFGSVSNFDKPLPLLVRDASNDPVTEVLLLQ